MEEAVLQQLPQGALDAHIHKIGDGQTSSVHSLPVSVKLRLYNVVSNCSGHVCIGPCIYQVLPVQPVRVA